MRIIRAATATLAAISLITSCQERQRNTSATDSLTPKAENDVDASFALAVGTWDVARGDSTCIGNTHGISFASDRQTMTLTSNAPSDTTVKERITTYNVLSAGPGKALGYKHVIRGRIDGETRRTDAGELVVWDLVLVTPNRYHWHRTDWPEGGMTAALVRCDGTRALEQWTPPPPPPPPPLGPRIR